ncbi:efflux RND transporter periplasmic adaptor subunit [Herbidospora mongoliensis]|uniref:efflux RND transporter periplasmic adaptor subunit n=1 Tax=Herbidospora mongoliensis TaxID=688067 RepID=UPI00082D0FB0|nr:HlyD family efflux transporter periplasmic adaptor subunit [Herbidospora mongoliensis]
MKLSTKRRALILNASLGVLLLGGAGAAWGSLGGGGEPAESGNVLTTTVTRGTVESAVTASGAVESSRSRSLGFATQGTVDSIAVEPGQKVKKGQVLARLDDESAQEGVDAAKAGLDAAEDGDTDTASGYSQYVSAKNAYQAAKRTLAGTVIKAPFAGTVTAVGGTVGGPSQVQEGGFVDIVDPKKLQIVGNFTESDVTKLKVGQEASITFDAIPGVTAAGEVALIGAQPQTENNVVNYAATIELTDIPEQVRLGQTASVSVVIERAENVLTLPSAVITTAGGRSTVTVLADGKQNVKAIETGVKGTTGTEIVSGLDEGDRVVRPVASTTGQTGGFPGFGGGGGIRPAGGGFGGGGRQ